MIRWYHDLEIVARFSVTFIANRTSVLVGQGAPMPYMHPLRCHGATPTLPTGAARSRLSRCAYSKGVSKVCAPTMVYLISFHITDTHLLLHTHATCGSVRRKGGGGSAKTATANGEAQPSISWHHERGIRIYDAAVQHGPFFFRTHVTHGT